MGGESGFRWRAANKQSDDWRLQMSGREMSAVGLEPVLIAPYPGTDNSQV